MASPPSSKKTAKRSTGRPKAQIDWNKVDQWLIAGANGTQIAASLGVYPDTLYLACEREFKTTFTAYSQEKRSIGDKLIHQAQFEVAVKNKNTTMLIWLGKQRCGQKDTDEQRQLNPKDLEKFDELMKQIKTAQSSACNIEDISKSSDK